MRPAGGDGGVSVGTLRGKRGGWLTSMMLWRFAMGKCLVWRRDVVGGDGI